MDTRESKTRGSWVTNTPKTIKGYWPRRVADFVEGPPKATKSYSVEELTALELVGVYLGEDLEVPLKALPLARNFKDFEELRKAR